MEATMKMDKEIEALLEEGLRRAERNLGDAALAALIEKNARQMAQIRRQFDRDIGSALSKLQDVLR